MHTSEGRFSRDVAQSDISLFQTSSTGATLDLVMLPYHPEFWLLAVSRDGTIATTRFNASVSEEAPYTQGIQLLKYNPCLH